MKVSIVTVVFNSVSVIEETILSVIYQKNASLVFRSVEQPKITRNIQA